jgi:hypothetical protein
MFNKPTQEKLELRVAELEGIEVRLKSTKGMQTRGNDLRHGICPD